MIEEYKITINGLQRYITSYEHLLFKESGLLEFGAGPLTTLQYLSCLFNNLGYDKCPKDFLWLENNIDIEMVEKTEVLDYPITRNPLMIVKDYDLFSLLLCIKNWIKAGIERGHILDPKKSFKLPSQKDIQFYKQNRVKLMRTAVLLNRVESWDKADLIWRRIYNLNPALDKEYFEYHIPNAEHWFKQIKIKDARPLFVSALINPDLLLSAIKQSEIEATSIIHSRYNIPIPLLNQQEIISEFERIFLRKVQQITNIFKNKGSRGFLSDEYKMVKINPGYTPSLGMNVNLLPPIYMGQNRQVDQSILGEIFYQIASIPITGDTISSILKYIDVNSLKLIDRMDQCNPLRLATYKRLYYTIEQLKSFNPELINPKDRLVFLESFYIDADSFGLYSKKLNKIYLVCRDLILREMDIKEAIEYYQIFLGKSVELDPNEIGNSLEPDIAPFVDLNMLEQNSFGYKTNIITQIVEPNNVNYKSYNSSEELYGFDVATMVEG